MTSELGSDGDLRVDRLRVDRRNDRAVADSPVPLLTWVVATSIPAWWQASAEVRLDGATTITLHTSESIFVAWPFAPIEPHSRHRVEVRVTGSDGSMSAWSTPVEFVAGFLAEDEWKACFVSHPDPTATAAPIRIRHEFTVSKPVALGELFVAAHGVYQVAINGTDVDDCVLKPGWTEYHSRLIHETTDVTSLLNDGTNVISVRLAGGWWTEEYGFNGNAVRVYGDQPEVAIQLRIASADGSTAEVTSDANWRVSSLGPMIASGIYAGESTDHRRETPGWDRPGFDDSAWVLAKESPCQVVPEAPIAEPVRRTMEVPVSSVTATPRGGLVVDFGQNLVGRVRIRVSGPAGHEIVVRHAEALENGELALRPLRYARATDRFMLGGGPMEEFEPEFTYHGFRYAELVNWPGEFDPAAVTAVVIGSDMRRTGWFECSEQSVNQLHENVVWSMRGNFVSLPTDCPQRDERLGWAGDIQVFSPTSCFLYDSDAFLASWLRDVAREQKTWKGVCPPVVPNVFPDWAAPGAAWGDAATVVPTVLYERFGDTRALSEQYPFMQAWTDAIVARCGDNGLWEGGFQFGDWLDPSAPPDKPGAARTHPDIVANAYLYRSASFTAKAAHDLGFEPAAQHYLCVAERVRTAFVREYVTPAGRLMSDAPTAYALALHFGLVEDPSVRRALGARLAILVRESSYHIATGFVGTPVILDALVETGHLAAAERLLTQTECPSWLYPVTMGATTVWERWDSMLEDGSINPGEMTSFNHYALGAVADWLHREIGGLAPAAPGYRRVRIAPLCLPSFSHATSALDSPYGRVSVAWRREAAGIVVTATLPANTRGVVTLPGSDVPFEVGSGTFEWRVASPLAAPLPPIATLGSSLAEVADSPDSYRSVITALAEIDSSLAARLRHFPWDTQRRLGDALEELGPGLQDPVEAALASLKDRAAE